MKVVLYESLDREVYSFFLVWMKKVCGNTVQFFRRHPLGVPEVQTDQTLN